MKNQRLGFTMIELLVVIAIIGILAAVVLASLTDARYQAKVRAAQREMRDIHTAMELLFNHTGLYPHKQGAYCPPRSAGGNEVNLASSASGLVATDGTYENWQGPYVIDVLDPWGNPYFLDEDNYCVGTAFGCNGVENVSAAPDSSVLMSCGPDGMLGNDLSNPQPANGSACAYNADNIVYILCQN